MSYQPNFATPSAQPPAKGKRRTRLLVFGVLLLLGGVGAGVAMFLASDSQIDKSVEQLQRAPVGCETEFDFTGTGTFIFYTETTGRIGSLRGDCENTDTDYSFRGDRVSVSLTLTDDDGDSIDLDRQTGISYDTGDFVGQSTRSVEIDKPGTYTLYVESSDEDFAIAVGRDPNDAGGSLKMIGIIVAAAGLVLGLLFILLGAKRKPPVNTGGTFAAAGPAPLDFGGANAYGQPVAPPFSGGPGFGQPTQPYGQPAQPYSPPGPQPPAPGQWGAPHQ